MALPALAVFFAAFFVALAVFFVALAVVLAAFFTAFVAFFALALAVFLRLCRLLSRFFSPGSPLLFSLRFSGLLWSVLAYLAPWSLRGRSHRTLSIGGMWLHEPVWRIPPAARTVARPKIEQASSSTSSSPRASTDRPRAGRAVTPARSSRRTSTGPPRCRCAARCRSTTVELEDAAARGRDRRRRRAPIADGDLVVEAASGAAARALGRAAGEPRQAARGGRPAFARRPSGDFDHCFVCGRARHDDGFERLPRAGARGRTSSPHRGRRPSGRPTRTATCCRSSSGRRSTAPATSPSTAATRPRLPRPSAVARSSPRSAPGRDVVVGRPSRSSAPDAKASPRRRSSTPTARCSPTPRDRGRPASLRARVDVTRIGGYFVLLSDPMEGDDMTDGHPDRSVPGRKRRSRPMTVAVVGGTGTLGNARRRRAARARGTGRGAQPQRGGVPAGAEHRRVDLTTGEGLDRALDGASRCVDAANSQGSLRGDAGRRDPAAARGGRRGRGRATT